MATKLFIDANYQQKAVLKEVPGIHPELTFTYRPCIPEERAQVIQKLGIQKSAACQERMMCDVLTKHISEWSAEEAITLENMVRIRPLVLNRLAAIVVYGTEAGDSDDKETEDMESEYEASIQKDYTPLIDQKIEDEVKN